MTKTELLKKYTSLYKQALSEQASYEQGGGNGMGWHLEIQAYKEFLADLEKLQPESTAPNRIVDVWDTSENF